MKESGKINYVEIPSADLAETRRFFSVAFGWSFVEYGPDYMAIEGAGLDGGFYQSDQHAEQAKGSVLVVLYADNLEQAEAQVKAAGGRIVKPIFSFPGGRRFHFCDPSGNEFAVWSE